MGITCCHGCVPPKRTPTCHSTCKEYKDQRATLDAENEAALKKKAIQSGIESNIVKGCLKVTKRRR